MDLAFVVNSASYNGGIKYLMVAVNILFRYVRVGLLESEDAKETALALYMIIRKEQPETIWIEEGEEFKGDFKKLCDRKGCDFYHSESESKPTFAEPLISPSENCIVYWGKAKFGAHFRSWQGAVGCTQMARNDQNKLGDGSSESFVHEEEESSSSEVRICLV